MRIRYFIRNMVSSAFMVTMGHVALLCPFGSFVHLRDIHGKRRKVHPENVGYNNET